MDAVPTAQSWKQFKGLNTKEMTSDPAFGSEQIGSAFSQFLQEGHGQMSTFPLHTLYQ